MKKKKTLLEKEDIAYEELPFIAREQYKRLRTNLQFTTVNEVRCPIIGVTSSLRGEGKSTTTINLAHTYAEQGNRVLLIDGDLRLPSVAKKMRTSNVRGLMDFVIGTEGEIEKFRSPSFENLYVLPSGKTPPNPSEVLGSERMKSLLKGFQERFDYIIVDLPPVNLVPDALAIANVLTGFVLVVRDGYTAKKQLEHCLRQLRFAKANVLGFVMNDVQEPVVRKFRKYNYYYE